MKILVVGAGALGSHFIQFARNLPVEFTVVDFDHVEYKNTLSQFHAKNSVGKSKVMSLVQTMQFLWNLRLKQSPYQMTPGNCDMLMKGQDLIVDCVDNGKTRRLIQEWVRRESTPCLHGALAADGSFGRVVWDEAFVIDDEGSGQTGTRENGEFLPFISIVSAYLARSAQVFLESGKRIGFQIAPDRAFRV